ncbi:hypothetical protein ACHAQJ_009318 [Trichoderma viride]
MSAYGSNSVLWWIGPEGDILSRRWTEADKIWDKEATVAAPARSVHVHGVRLPHLQAMWERHNSSNTDLLWVGLAGELKLTRLKWRNPDPVTISAVPDANAAPYTSLASIYVERKGYAFWLTLDGAVWGVRADEMIDYGPNHCDPIDGPHMWHKFRVAPPGSAHLRSGLSITWLEVSAETLLEAGMMLAWIRPSGRLQTATTREDKASDYTCWSWNQLGPDVKADPNGNLNVVVVLATDSKGIPSKLTVGYIGVDGHLQCRGVMHRHLGAKVCHGEYSASEGTIMSRRLKRSIDGPISAASHGTKPVHPSPMFLNADAAKDDSLENTSVLEKMLSRILGQEAPIV